MKTIYSEDKGAVSVFLVIILPVLILGALLVYDLLAEKGRENRALITGAAYSETMLSSNNSYLYENYGVLAYISGTGDEDVLKTYLVENRIAPKDADLNVTMAHDSLNRSDLFYEATQAAAFSVAATGITEALVEQLASTERFKALYETFSDVEEKISGIFEADTVATQIVRLMKKDNPGRESEVIGDWIAEKQKVLKAGEQVLEKTIKETDAESDPDLQGEMERMKTLLNEGEAWLQKAEALRKEIDRYSEERRAVADELEEVKQDIREIKAEIERRKEELGDTADTVRLEEKLEARRAERDDLEDDLEEMAKQWMKYLAEQNDIFEPKHVGLLDTAAALAKQLQDVLDVSFDVGDKAFSPSESVIDQRDLEAGVIGEKLLLNEYYLAVFKSFDKGSPRNFDPLGKKDQRKSVLDGEIEYLIAGTKSDSMNAWIVRGEIYGIRETANLIYLLKDSEKMKALTELTMPIPQPWQAISFGAILVLWSGAESYLDLKQLTAGEGFHFIKTADEWVLELDDLTGGNWITAQVGSSNGVNSDSELGSELGLEPGSGPQAGWDLKIYYQDYLRLLLIPHSAETINFRAMQLVEGNMRLVSHDAFGLENLAVSHVISVSWYAQPLLRPFGGEGHYELINGYETR